MKLLPRGAIVLFVLADVVLVGYGAYLLRLAPAIGVELTAAAVDSGCAWELAPPDDPEAESFEGGCVTHIAGVELGPHSLARDAAYLPDHEAVDDWLADQQALHDALDGVDAAELTVTGADGRSHGRTVVVGRMAAGETLRKTGFNLATAFAILLIGAFVLWKRPLEAASRGLFAFCQGAAGGALITSLIGVRDLAFPAGANRLLYETNMLVSLVGAAGVFYLTALFPAPRLGRWSRRLAPAIALGLAVLAWIAEAAGVPQARASAAMLLAVAGIVLLVISLLRPMRQVQRLQARWVLWGVGATLLVVAVLRVPMLLDLISGRDTQDTPLILAMIPVPLGVAIAIARYRLLDIEVVVRRTIVGAVVTIGVLFAYNLALSVFAIGIAEPSSGADWFTPVLITAVVLTFVLVPAQTRIEGLLDRIFFRNRYNYRRVLAQIPNDLATLDTPDQAADTVLTQVGASMETNAMVVSLAPGVDGGRHWSRVSAGITASRETPAGASLQPPDDPDFWAQVKRTSEVHFCSSEETAGLLDHWLISADLDLLLPLRTEEQLVGLLASSAPPGGTLLSAEDVGLLRSVSSSLAMALSRSLAVETIRTMNLELEERIRERTVELEHTRLQLYQWEKMASLGVLAAGVAHELNTPLGVVLSSADQLNVIAHRGEASPRRLERLTQLCLDGAQRAADIVQNLRAFSKPESQDLQVVDLHEMLDSTLRLMDPTLRSRGIAVHQNRGDVVPIEGYPVLLNQLFTNLMLNAASAVDQDGEIRVFTERRGTDRIALIVEDDGPGIPDELGGRIFEPFFTTRPPGEGTGLGLSLCYTFVEQHGGRIWEEGKAGEGARFVIELPLRHPTNLRERALIPQKAGE